MVAQLLVGGAVSIVNISIHALATTWVIQLGRTMGKSARSRSSVFLIRVMIVTVSVLMLAHFCEVCVWALAYSILKVMPASAVPRASTLRSSTTRPWDTETLCPLSAGTCSGR